VSAPPVFALHLRGVGHRQGQTVYGRHYGFQVRGLRSPLRPLVGRTSDTCWASGFWQDPALRQLAAPVDADVRLVLAIEGWTFTSRVTGVFEAGRLRTLDLHPLPTFTPTPDGQPTLIGHYQPFDLDPGTGRHRLLSWFLGDFTGLTQTLERLDDTRFALTPKLFLPLDLDRERERITRERIAYLGPRQAAEV
jgi:hypothetical protein